MVSRFPAGAPIHINNDNPGELVTLATFNRSFTREELLGKLELVVYIDNGEDDFAGLMHTASEQPANPSAISVINEDGTEGRLYIDGTSLKVYNNSFATSNAWIFDIDFDHQHRKNLELTEGFYYLEIPQLIEASPGSDLHAVVRMGSSLEDGLYIVAYSSGDAVVYSTEDSTIDLGAWFGDNTSEEFLEEYVSEIFLQLIRMEYHTTNTSIIETSKYDDISGIAVDGSFNPFTDGSPYVPPVSLRVVERFPNGCPVTASMIEAAGETGVPLITFNRPILPEEIDTLVAVVYNENTTSQYTANGGLIYDSSSSFKLYLRTAQAGDLELRQEGSTLYATSSTDLMDVIDIDYDEQSKRILDLTNAPTNGVQKYITLPAFGAYNLDMAVCVKLYSSSSGEDEGTYRIIGNSDGDIKWWDNINGQADYEDAENMPNNKLIAIMNAVMNMEFANITEGPGITTDFTNPTGPINLLTATEL